MKGDKRTVALVAVVGIEELASLLCDAAGEGEHILHNLASQWRPLWWGKPMTLRPQTSVDRLALSE